VIFDAIERLGVVIDPVLDFDPASGRTSTVSADAVAAFIDASELRIPYVLDTHAHADHITALPYFKARYDAKTAIGALIGDVQKTLQVLFNLDDPLARDGRPFDVLLADGDRIDVGPFEIEALHTPGHTPACLSYRIGDALFVGDALLQPDYGTARCDFPGGSAAELYASISRLYETLPPETRVLTCHDYQPGGRPLQFESTIAEQRDSNIQLNRRTLPEAFVTTRNERDAQLDMPRLFLPSIQMNIRAGQAPPPESNGISYLKLPLNAFGH
jgi:glyoxylase-like metal-dependent hydrolase (beta-lactamase superfamily II)